MHRLKIRLYQRSVYIEKKSSEWKSKLTEQENGSTYLQTLHLSDKSLVFRIYVEHSNLIADKSKEDNAHDLIFKLANVQNRHFLKYGGRPTVTKKWSIYIALVWVIINMNNAHNMIYWWKERLMSVQNKGLLPATGEM